MTHPPRPTTLVSHTEPTPQTCWATACRAPAREQDREVIPKYCSDPCEQRTVAERQVVIDGERPAVHLHPGPVRVERPAPVQPDAVQIDAVTSDGPVFREPRTVPELIVEACAVGSARLRHLMFGRGGR